MSRSPWAPRRPLRYDPDGRLLRRTTQTPSVGIRGDSLRYDARGKIVSNQSQAGADAGAEFLTWYTGAGQLAATRWQGQIAGSLVEEFRGDALGHVRWKRMLNSGLGEDRDGPQLYVAGVLESIATSRDAPGIPYEVDPDTTWVEHSYSSGLRLRSGRRQYRTEDFGLPTRIGTEASSYYYGADQKLAAYQKYDDREGGNRHGVYEEYRYDALGRRVLLRARADTLCTVACVSATQRYVWDGDQLLHELRAPGGNNDNPDLTIGAWPDYGTVSYTHAEGIDDPLGILREGGVIVPHANWRGLYDRGTNGAGQMVPDVRWPGQRVAAYLTPDGTAGPRGTWIGSLAKDLADQSGLLYRRNRYYDPGTGQFTQEDPIGLVGGLNLYGYANGDPVNFSDPFGLCPEEGQSWWDCVKEFAVYQLRGFEAGSDPTRFSIDFDTIEYRVFTLSGNRINIGTYYPIP